MAKEYVLGTGMDELGRLAFQHRLWSDATHSAWLEAQLMIGQRVLDVGCGPGFAAFDLAQLVTPAGQVVAIDESPAFIEYLNQQAASRGLPQLQGRVGDVQKLAAVLSNEPGGADEPKGSDPSRSEATLFDLAWVRWVLCFVRDPESVVAGIAQALKPGGRVVIHDYFGYQSLRTAPFSRAHERAVAATIESWRSRGGDPDVGGRLPGWLEKHGFAIQRFQAHARVARSTDSMFQWAEVWWKTWSPKLVETGFLDAADQAELMTDIENLKRDATGFIQCPVVYEFIAGKN